MLPRKPSLKVFRSLCAEVGPDDGLDPRDEVRGTGRKPDRRKARQLCAQAAEAIESALAESPEDLLQLLRVVSVEPAPDTSRLLVTVAPIVVEAVEPERILQHLERASARLRTAMAAAITRRKAPSLAFRLTLPADAT